jgi:sulfopyruvate decarboxylase TPP-binding subunit
MSWAESFLGTLKENDVRLVTYVPDNVLTPLITGACADNYFITVGTTREDEAIGVVAGAWMAGMRGCIMMQTSGFGTLPNALASLLVPYRSRRS